MQVEPLFGSALGSANDNFVIVEWTAEVGDHWIAPLHVHEHTYWNAGASEARYLLVMTPRIAHLIEEIHRPGADVAAVFAAHDSRLV